MKSKVVRGDVTPISEIGEVGKQRSLPKGMSEADATFCIYHPTKKETLAILKKLGAEKELIEKTMDNHQAGVVEVNGREVPEGHSIVIEGE